MFYKRINPPEVRKGDKYSTASDIYQYGMVLYEMLFLRKKVLPSIISSLVSSFANQ